MIPDYQTLMLPVLKAASDQEVKTKEVVETLAKQFNLTQEEREQMLPSGQQRTFDNRVHWAKSYLKQAGLLRYPKRGSFVITDEGKKVLDSGLDRIDTKYLRSFAPFQDFQQRRSSKPNMAWACQKGAAWRATRTRGR